MDVLRIHDVSKTFGSGHTAVNALTSVNLQVAQGDIVLIMGPSGSGKTTLLTIAGGLLKSTSGEVSIGGQDITKLSEHELPAIRLKTLGFVFQSFNLLAALTAEQNVALPLLMRGVPYLTALKQARPLLQRLGVGQRLGSLPYQLSGGEKQRVAIARALVNSPSLVLADEPTANLDSNNGHEVLQLFCEIACQEGRAVIIVSHDSRIRDIAKRVLTIEDGRLVKEEVGGHDTHCRMHDRPPK